MKHRYSVNLYSFYDQHGIADKLARMAAKGWMIQQMGNFLWKYRRCEPAPLRFAVVYQPGVSVYDPAPDPRQQETSDLCASQGWTQVTRWGAMQVFATAAPDAPPLETDPVAQVETIHRAMRKSLPAYLLLVGITLFELFLRSRELWRDPAQNLSDPMFLCGAAIWLAALLISLWEIIGGEIWYQRAKAVARQQGGFLPVRSRYTRIWMLVVVVLFAASLAAVGRGLPVALTVLAVVACAVWLSGTVSRRLSRIGVSRWVNILVVFLCALAVVGVGTAAIAAVVLRTGFSFRQEHEPAYTVIAQDGHAYDVYDDPLPLTIEQLAPVQERWSKTAQKQGTFLAQMGQYRQWNAPGEPLSRYNLDYTIVDTRWQPVYDCIVQGILRDHQDEGSLGGEVLRDLYLPVDPAPWQAEQVYRLHWSDSVQDRYLVCWPGRIVEITFYWQATPEQLARAAEILRPAA